MWYEILPCIGIIGVCISLPPVINYQISKWWQDGNPYRRYVLPEHNLGLYFRDVRLTGTPYKQQEHRRLVMADDELWNTAGVATSLALLAAVAPSEAAWLSLLTDIFIEQKKS